MATVEQIIENIDIYRNSYSTIQKVGWMDTVQKQIFQDVPHEAVPYVITTLAGEAFYAIPPDCDPMGVKTISIETAAGSGKYRTLRYMAPNSTDRVGAQDEFYSIQAGQNFFFNPVPTETTAGRKVYVVYNKRPATLSSGALTAVPELEEDFHELLELGVKIRIARERGEEEDQARFQRDYDRLHFRYKERYKVQYPVLPKTKDVMPGKRRGLYGGRSTNRVSDLIPE